MIAGLRWWVGFWIFFVGCIVIIGSGSSCESRNVAKPLAVLENQNCSIVSEYYLVRVIESELSEFSPNDLNMFVKNTSCIAANGQTQSDQSHFNSSSLNSAVYEDLYFIQRPRSVNLFRRPSILQTRKSGNFFYILQFIDEAANNRDGCQCLQNCEESACMAKKPLVAPISSSIEFLL
jgi:hypothetical protein